MLWSRFKVTIGWRKILKRLALAIYKDNCFGWSAELAYYYFFALFPALLFLVALAGYVPIENLIDQVMTALGRVAPGAVTTLTRNQLDQIAASQHGGLLTFGIIATLWSMSSGMTAVVDTLNQAYHVTEGRQWWRVRVTAILLAVALVAFVLTSFILLVVGPALGQRLAAELGLGFVFSFGWKILQWPLVFLLVAAAVSMVYYIAPDVDQRWLWIVPGAVFATVLWVLMSVGLKWYVEHFANYQATYGAIGGVIVLLLWLYFSGFVLLVGAELNAVIEHASIYGKNPGEKTALRPPVPSQT